MADEPVPAPAPEPAPAPAPAPAPEPPKTAEPAPAEPKPGDPPKADDPPKEPPKAPEPVDYGKVIAEVAMPEGMTLDPALAKTGTEVFAKHNIPAEAVKDLVSLYAQQQKAGADGNAKLFADQVTAWKGEADKSTSKEEQDTAKAAALSIFGKDELVTMELFGLTNRAGFIKALSPGVAWAAEAEKVTTPQERGDAKAAAVAIFGKDEAALLERHGIANRANFIKSLSKLAKDMSIKGDTFVPGNAGAANGAARDARSLYPNSNMNP